MAFHVTHRMGDMDSDPPLESLAALLDELEDADAEHPDVALTGKSEWCLSAFANGDLVYENLESRTEPRRHLKAVDRETVLTLFRALATQDWETLNRQPWLPGYP